MHAYTTRYAMTNIGPVRVRTRIPITAARARRIIERQAVRFPADERDTPIVVKAWIRLADTMGWLHVYTLHDESLCMNREKADRRLYRARHRALVR